MEICPICGNINTEVYTVQNFFAKKIQCPLCGNFLIENDALSQVESNLRLKSILFFYLTQKRSSHIMPHFHNNSNWEDGPIEGQNRVTISLKSLRSLYPFNFSQKIDYSLLNIATMIKYVGNTFLTKGDQEDEYLYPLFWVDEQFGKDSLNVQFEEMIYMLCELNYLKQEEYLGDLEYNYTLTVKGWDRVDKLQAEEKQVNQAFIAMWFDDSMNAARAQIMAAIESCNYVPIIIDQKEHNNQIVPEIFYEIKQSRFVVVDLTGHRNGVYYEAEYAEALGKEVILCCREDSFQDKHFDVAQKNTVVWRDEEDLFNRLIKRIKATVGELK